jgi:L-asparagine transporter-like permease
MKNYDIFIIFVILVKLVFLILAVTHLYLKKHGKNNSKKDIDVLFWKERVEFVFIILMACLLIYLFNPRNNRLFMIDYETKILLFLFGFILIITAKWETFFEESEVFKDVQSSV